MLAGRHASRLRGRGLNFEELRAYLPGDDIRTLDWKVTARTREPHVRVYTEERDRSVWLVVDQRISMFFGSRVKMKATAAAEAAGDSGAAERIRQEIGGAKLRNSFAGRAGRLMEPEELASVFETLEGARRISAAAEGWRTDHPDLEIPRIFDLTGQIPGFTTLCDRIDSVLDDRGRVLLRYSGTEPLARVMVEGEDAAEVEALCAGLAADVERELA